MQIIVQRSPGDRQGPDITVRTVRGAAALSQLGRNKIDHNCSDRAIVNGVCRYQPGVRPGSVVALQDAELGLRKGIIDGDYMEISRTPDGFSASLTVKMELLNNESY